MATQKLLLLPGDGIGPEVMGEVEKLIAWMNKTGLTSFETERDLVGGSAYDAHKVAITDAAMKLAHESDAVVFGAVGGPKWDKVPYEARPEAGLLRLRKELELFANLRPAICYPALADASSLKRELVEGLDIVIVRELTGGVYFGEPKEIVCRIFCCPSENTEVVRQAAKFAIAAYLNVPVYAAFHEWLGRGPQLQGMWDAWKAGDRKAALAAIPDEVVDELVVHGSPAECRKKIDAYFANGVTTSSIAIMALDPELNYWKAVEELSPSRG